MTHPTKLPLASPFTALASLCAALATPPAHAATVEMVYPFVINVCNQPSGSLLRMSDGTLYGTCYGGGTNGSGVAYSLTPDQQFHLLHTFDNVVNSDGKQPTGGLVMTPDGLLWGLTDAGGPSDSGVLYSLSTSGTYTQRASFIPSTGTRPRNELVPASDGKLYGNTYEGGGSKGRGTLFSFTPASGPLKTVLRYTTALGPINPTNRPALGPDGLLYGAAADPHPGGNGQLYRVRRDGTGYEQLASFRRSTQGAQPRDEVTVLADGAVYGVNTIDGPAGKGTIYRWRESDGLTVMHTFTGGVNDGEQPMSGLTQGADGALYGTTRFGGANGSNNGGTVYRMALDGSYSVVHSFDPTQPLGYEPAGTLTLGDDGKLYGVTLLGGASEFQPGAIFRIVP